MSTSSSTACSQGCVQNYLEGIQHQVYSIGDQLCGLCSTDNKTYVFLILGRGLQAAALAGCAASVAYTFMVGPMALVGLVAAVAFGILGTYLAGSPQELSAVLQMACPFIPGQPIGLANSGNNCWLNSGLQILANVPAFEPRLRQFPIFAQFLDAYQAARTQQHKVAPSIDSQHIRQFLSRETGGMIDLNYMQEDPSVLFEYLFRGTHSLYHFEHQLDGTPATPRSEPMIQLDIQRESPIPTFEQLFHTFFDHWTDRGQRQQLFFQNSPQDLLIQIKRFYRDYRGVQGKVNDAIPMPATLQLPPTLVRLGPNGVYHCDAFLTHNGYSPEGGHYDAYIKSGSAWWYCSDSGVYEVSAQQALAAMQYSYILHYTQTTSRIGL